MRTEPVKTTKLYSALTPIMEPNAAPLEKKKKRGPMPKAVKRRRAVYKTYRFNDVDPVLEVITSAIKLSNRSPRQIAQASGVSATTLFNWKAKRTRRPQFCTIAAVAGALHQEFVLRRKR